jgi:hypothetical protein
MNTPPAPAQPAATIIAHAVAPLCAGSDIPMLVFEYRGKQHRPIAFGPSTYGRTAADLVRVELAETWAGGGLARLVWLVGEPQEVAFGHRRPGTRPCREGGRSKAALAGWV